MDVTRRARHVCHSAATLALAVAVPIPSAGGDSHGNATNPQQGSTIVYREISAAAGVMNVWDGYGFGAGVAAEDLDVDGDVDLVILNHSGAPNRLFENVGDLDELGNPQFKERTDAGMVDLGNSKGIVCADYNNDGLPDLVVSNYDMSIDRRENSPGFKSCITLYRNDGNLQFTDVTQEAGLHVEQIASHGISAADIDNDGWLDLFVCNRGGLDDIKRYRGGFNLLYRNRGDGTFEDISAASGIADASDENSTNLTLQSGFFDYDNDGDLDLYLANDKLGGNQLYRNNGNSTFTDVSSSSGDAGVVMNGMCVAFGDYDQDTDLDVYITNTAREGHVLLRNNGAGKFTNVAAESGVFGGRIGWGARWLDVDHDTHVDLYVVHFGINNHNALFRNQGNGSFVDVATQAGCLNPADGFGLAEADFNLDGAPDFIVTNANHPCGLFVHDGTGNAWMRIKLIGTASNRDAVGARLVFHGAITRQVREIVAGDAYLSHSATEAHFGFGLDGPKRLEIRWPSGAVESIDASRDGLWIQQRHRIIEGHGIQEGTVLVDHNVQSDAGVVRLAWETVQWPDDVGFRIERSLVVGGVPSAPEVLATVSDAGRWHDYTDVVSGDASEPVVYRYAVHVEHGDGSASVLFESGDIQLIPVAVTLQDLQIAATTAGVEMRWRLSRASLGDMRSVVVQRASAATGPWTTLHSLDAARDMSFLDPDARAAHDYWYRLLLEYRDGSRTATLAVGLRVPDGNGPRAALAPPIESADGGPVRLSFTLGQPGDIELQILDARGRRVATVVRGARDAGMHIVSWDRTGSASRRVARGVYFVQLRADRFVTSRKLVVLH